MDRAYEVSERNLATCRETPKVNDKLLSRAYYNIGILHTLRAEYDAALEFLLAAAELRPDGAIVHEAIASARKAKEVAASMQRHEELASIEVARRDAEEDQRREEAWARTLRNVHVIDMVKEGVPTSTIVMMVDKSRHDFDTSPTAIVALVKAGVEEQIINAMVAAK